MNKPWRAALTLVPLVLTACDGFSRSEQHPNTVGGPGNPSQTSGASSGTGPTAATCGSTSDSGATPTPSDPGATPTPSDPGGGTSTPPDPGGGTIPTTPGGPAGACAGASYIGFGGEALEATRVNAPLGTDVARVKPYT